MLVSIGIKLPSMPKSFTFFNYWAQFDEFIPMSTEAWKEKGRGNKMSILYQKLRLIKDSLIKW